MEPINREAQNGTPKIILQRHVLADGNVAFTIGTRKDHVEKQYPFDIPLHNILDYVSPYELTRFETQEFLKEDEKEEEERQLKLLHKPRGRPKKSLQVSLNTSPRDIQFTTPRTGEKRGRGRPRKFPSTVPSFNGPQPVPTTPTTGTATTPIGLSSEVSSDESITPRRRQYSMVTASGFLPPDISEEETSREVSVNRAQPHRTEPLAKRRKTASDTRYDTTHRSTLMTPMVRIPQTPHAVATSQGRHTPSRAKIVDLETENSESEEVDTVKVQRGVSIGESTPAAITDMERETLLKQFLTRDTRATSTETTSSSSSDSLMSRAIVAERTQRLSIHSLPPNLARPSLHQPPITATTKPVRRTISPSHNEREVYVAHTKTPPTRSTQLRQSMTPHFPYARSTNRIKSTSPKPPPRPLNLSQSIWQPATAIRPQLEPPTQRINLMSTAPKVKQSQDTITPTSRSSSFKIRPLEPTNDIRRYFRPRYNPLPSQECADSADEDSESDGTENRVSTRIGGLFRPKYTAIKQESGSEYEDRDEEEDSDDHIPHNSSQPQVSQVLAGNQHSPLRTHHQQPPFVKEEPPDSTSPNSPDPDPIDLIPRSTIPSPPAPHTHPIRPPTNPTTVMAIESPQQSDSSSEQEYLSAEEPELKPSINMSSSVRNIHTGAELDADTEEDSDGDEGDGNEDGDGSADEVLIGVREGGR